MASRYEMHSTNVLEISIICKKHNKELQMYCKQHDSPCCSQCAASDHQMCQDFIQLKDMVQNVKKSYGLHDIQQTITDMLDNIQRIKTKHQANLSTLKEERKLIEKEIEQTRITINAQLDKLQEGIMKELYETESKESKMIGQLLDSIEKKEKEIKKYQENIVNIKQHASDLQTFLAMKQMEQQVAEKDKYFTSLVKSNKFNGVSLSCKMNDALQNISKEIKTFGEVTVIIGTSSSDFEIVRKKRNQAQIVIAPASSKSIDNTSINYQATIDTQLDDIRGCTFLPDGRMVFTCYQQRCIRGFNRDGSQDFDISLQPVYAFDITYIYDNNTIAVTGGAKLCCSIIDVTSRKVKETIPLGSYNDGIVSRNNTLMYCAGWRGLRMIDLTDKSVSNIVSNEMSLSAYVTTFGDKLYFTNGYEDTVICCDLYGKTQWYFKDTNALKQPHGISVDNSGNVYVVGYNSHSVVVISPDGLKHRQLLSAKDGLIKPHVIHCDRSSNLLLVANEKRKAFLYKLK